MAIQISDQSNAFLNPNQLIHLQNDQLYTTSKEVADAFGKRHDDVLRKIRTLECSEEYLLRNFAEKVRTIATGDGGQREVPIFHLTKNGFIWLVMGFTGKKAARIKEAYITAFDLMYEQLFKPQYQLTAHLTKFSPTRPRDYMSAVDALFELSHKFKEPEIVDRLEYVRDAIIDYHTAIQQAIPGLEHSLKVLRARHGR